MEKTKKQNRRKAKTILLPNGEVVPVPKLAPGEPMPHWKTIYAKYIVNNCVNWRPNDEL
jgi:hypothetical protein